MYGKFLVVASLFMCAAALVAAAPAGHTCAQHGPGPRGRAHCAAASSPLRPANPPPGAVTRANISRSA